MKQLTLSFLLMLLPLLASADKNGSCGDNVTFTYVEATQTLTISGYGNMWNYDGNCPWESYKSNIIIVDIKEGVTSIGDRAFYGFPSLISITIPEGVTRIGHQAFYDCGQLVSITFPESLTSLGNDIFRYCSSLSSITIPEGVTKIGDNTFCMSGLTSVIIPEGVTAIGYEAFYSCSKLTSVTIPSSVKSIGNSAFNYCYQLSSVIINEGVTSIGSLAFGYCNLTTISIPKSVTSIGSGAFSNCYGLTSITIPDGVTIIEESTFNNCGLSSISLPDGLKSIKNGAFSNCGKLESILIPVSVEFIYANAFKDCSKLKEVKVLPENPPFLFENAFSNYESITLKMPKESQELYMGTSPWDKFGKFQTLTGEDIVKKKCATPTICFEAGKIKFTCETEGVEFVSNISTADAKDYYDAEVTLTYKYKVTVYATKDGYENSDTATAEFTATGKVGDLNGDGKVNVADHVKLSEIIMNQ